MMAAAALLLVCGAVMAENRQTVVIDGKTVAEKAQQLTFDGDNVNVKLADGTTRTADMSTVSISFEWGSQTVDDNLPGDVNVDKVVDLEDIKQIIASISRIGTTTIDADANKDGKIDIADLMYVLNIVSAKSASRRAAELPLKWDFSQTFDSDVAALAKATSEWTYTDETNRYENTKAISGPLVVGGTELQLTTGLTFDAPEKKLRIDVGKRIQLAGKNVVVTTPSLKKGQTVTIVFASTGTNAVTFDANTNLTNAKGFEAADKNTTQTGTATVAADGAVSFKSTGGSINIFSIEVAEGQDTPASQDIIANAVARNTNQNQAVLTLTNGSINYYNTTDLLTVDIDNQTGLIILTTQTFGLDLYNASVSSIKFAKKQDTGQEPVVERGAVKIIEAQGWLESLYAKWELLEGANGYNVYVKGGQYSDWTKIDNELVRNYGTYGRADIVGLQAGNYELKVVSTKDGVESNAVPTTVSGLVVKNYPRQGFAFMNGYEPGAYQSDGTLKKNAKVFYVTKKTAKTITTNVAGAEVNPCVGLQAIIAAYEKGLDTTPIAFRFIGMVEKDDLDAIGSSEEGLQVKGRKADSELNFTFEGIGEDATLRGFGFLVRNSKSVEFRNLGIMRCMDDGISMDTDNSNIWVHHCDMFYGKHGSGDHDKGDGQVDVKSDSKLVTVSYNRFWDTGKTNMFGMKSESGPNYISYDHNWFDHSDSRHPRVRSMSVHVWNNYFDNVAKYGVGATTGASVFVESNYFLKTKKPILSSLQGTDGLGSGTFSGENGGMIKAYGNYFDRTAVHFSYYTQAAPSSKGYDAYETATRDEQVPATEKALVGGTTYNNFDTNSSLMYKYSVDPVADVPSIVTGYFGAGRLNHGDFTYTFKDNVGIDDDDSAYDATLGSLLDSYKSRLVGFFGEKTTEDPVGPDTPEDPTPEEGVILASFDGAPSSSLFTVTGEYGDGKITYEGTYYKKGAKLNSKTTVSFTPQKDYKMTLVLATAKSGRDVSLNGAVTTVSGTQNTEGAYYELQPIVIKAGTKYSLTRGSAESILMLVKLEPVTE